MKKRNNNIIYRNDTFVRFLAGALINTLRASMLSRMYSIHIEWLETENEYGYK